MKGRRYSHQTRDGIPRPQKFSELGNRNKCPGRISPTAFVGPQMSDFQQAANVQAANVRTAFVGPQMSDFQQAANARAANVRTANVRTANVLTRFKAYLVTCTKKFAKKLFGLL
ncbi:hypothetical protein niasHT_010181 [Heterodera trifolii]|uniref:Uncharacterized protein n=1 Tax=Heterodera trifolii TaxID=157864 RepID=A0ABD2LWH3_9BILA